MWTTSAYSRNRIIVLQLLQSLLSFSAANKYISYLILTCQYRVDSPGDKSCVLLVVKITDAVESTWEPISRQHPPIIAMNDNPHSYLERIGLCPSPEYQTFLRFSSIFTVRRYAIMKCLLILCLCGCLSVCVSQIGAFRVISIYWQEDDPFP